jgi:hypothetical protein
MDVCRLCWTCWVSSTSGVRTVNRDSRQRETGR